MSVLAPAYRGIHHVYPAGWNYTNDMKSGHEIVANFTYDPPSYNDAIGVASVSNDVLGESSTDSHYSSRKKTSTDRNGYSRFHNPDKKQFSEPTKFIDASPPGELSVEPKVVHGNSPSHVSKFLQVTDSFLIKTTRPPSPRFRDSIRIYKKR